MHLLCPLHSYNAPKCNILIFGINHIALCYDFHHFLINTVCQYSVTKRSQNRPIWLYSKCFKKPQLYYNYSINLGYIKQNITTLIEFKSIILYHQYIPNRFILFIRYSLYHDVTKIYTMPKYPISRGVWTGHMSPAGHDRYTDCAIKVIMLGPCNRPAM